MDYGFAVVCGATFDLPQSVIEEYGLEEALPAVWISMTVRSRDLFRLPFIDFIMSYDKITCCDNIR